MTGLQRLSDDQLKQITIEAIRRIKTHMAEEEQKKKDAEEKNEIYVPKEPAFFFAVRIRSHLRASPDVISALKCLRLHRVHSGTFVANNKSNRANLHKVKSYVAYGTLSIETIRKLLYTKGFCKYNGQRTNITPEVMFEKFGGEINTVEEIVEALFLGRANSSAINKWLWHFRLSCPVKGFGGRKIKDFADGGSSGDNGRYLDALVSRMLE
ncbi:large subunit ribosomal protein L7e [Nematocida sp. AWRm77]|nr:large subunit ribosomal protein L7e [Nematocida sp. AWRm77]